MPSLEVVTTPRPFLAVGNENYNKYYNKFILKLQSAFR